MSIAAFRAELGDIHQEDNPRIVQQRSRDHYWYSPVLKEKLDHVTAEVVVSPKRRGRGEDRPPRRVAMRWGWATFQTRPKYLALYDMNTVTQNQLDRFIDGVRTHMRQF